MFVLLISRICIGFCINFYVKVGLKIAENRVMNIIEMGIEYHKKRYIGLIEGHQ